MEHSHIDAYARLDSPVHRVDPRVKIVTLLAFLVIYVYLNHFWALALALLPVVFLIKLSRLPWGHFFSRLLWLAPFGGVMALTFPFFYGGDILWSSQVAGFNLTFSRTGLIMALLLLLRMAGALTIMVLLTSTTIFRDLLKGMADLKVPGIFIQLGEFTVRYIFVFIDELKRMKRARKSRAGRTRGGWWNKGFIRGLGETVGLLFLRAYERGENVYQAMLARAFNGEIKSLSHFHLRTGDIIWGAFMVLWVVLLKIVDWGGNKWIM